VSSLARIEAAEWLTRLLAVRGPQPRSFIEMQAGSAGIAPAELQQAIDDMNVEAVLRLPADVRVLVNGKR
jgi:hypothetical protein